MKDSEKIEQEIESNIASGRAPWLRLRRCKSYGCDRLVERNNQYCAGCSDEIAGLERMIDYVPAVPGSELERRREEAEVYARQARKGSSRLAEFGWACVCVAAVAAFLFATRSFWIELWRLWGVLR